MRIGIVGDSHDRDVRQERHAFAAFSSADQSKENCPLYSVKKELQFAVFALFPLDNDLIRVWYLILFEQIE